jgi:hypothetical protein
LIPGIIEPEQALFGAVGGRQFAVDCALLIDGTRIPRMLRIGAEYRHALSFRHSISFNLHAESSRSNAFWVKIHIIQSTAIALF